MKQTRASSGHNQARGQSEAEEAAVATKDDDDDHRIRAERIKS